MSRPIICDLCSQQCNPRRLVEVSGWWGKTVKFKGSEKGKKGEDVSEPMLRSDLAQLTADICSTCMAERLSEIQLHQHQTRDQWVKAQMKDGRPGLELLRRSSGWSVDNVWCDVCQAECYDQYLRLRGNWELPEHDLRAEICPACVLSRLTFTKSATVADSAQ